MLFFLMICYSWLITPHPLLTMVGLGDSIVFIAQEKNGEGKAFVHLHQNETTALKAARFIVNTEGGQLLTLIHKGSRNIVFHMNNKRYEFDPNRIFTDAGIKKTLTEFGNDDQDARQAVRHLAHAIKKLLPKKTTVIAVHNNNQYSLLDYYPDHNLTQDAQSLHINLARFYRNFYLVTSQSDFLRLKNLGFNSILQAPLANNDGSLSILLSHNRYINVEAGYDQLTEQINMLRHS